MQPPGTAKKEKGLFASKVFDSRIKSANVQLSERVFGFFVSPAIIYIAYYVLSGTFLMQFYTDVMQLGGVAGGVFLTLLPILSKVFDAITNLVMGQIIDRTHSRQGKARPWLLIAGPFVAITGVMLYAIPKASTTVQAIWVAVSYNLFFAFAFTIYNMAQTLLVPLSTRNIKQRDGNATLLNMGMNMIPGALVYMIFPMVALPWMGVDKSRWVLIMSVISILVLPGMLLQYYFTKERVTEEGGGKETGNISLGKQVKTCFSDKYWVIFFLMFMLYHFQQNVFSTFTQPYCNWVLGKYSDGITITLVNAIGQTPLGVGVFILWPLVKKVGKRKLMIFGMLIAAAFTFPMIFLARSMPAVLALLFMRSFGQLPSYTMMAMMAEAMDHIEWKNGYRCDGFTATMCNVLLTIMMGIAQSVYAGGLTATGYIAPGDGMALEDVQAIVQPVSSQNFFITGFAAIPAICFVLIAVLAYLNKLEPMMPQISADIVSRHKAEAEARGEVYVSPEELAAQELAESERSAEEIRIRELKARCEKKGLSFEEEEAKYQKALAEKKAKAEAKKK